MPSSIAIAAYVAGLITVLSPCVWPVLPFVLSRSGRPFVSHGLPLLLGMGLSFAAMASLVAVAGDRIAAFDDWARGLALIALAVSAVGLLIPAFASWATRPVVALGQRLLGATGAASAADGGTWARAFGFGMAIGLVWTPCAGPVLGLVFTGAAIQGPSLQTTTLLAVYALGACTPMAAVLLGGRGITKMFGSSLRVAGWLRKATGGLALLAVVTVANGWDRTVLPRWSTVDTTGIERAVLNRLGQAKASPIAEPSARASHPVSDLFAGASGWLNTPALQAKDLQGKVVLVHFWTYSCINCLRALPYIKAWAEKYKSAGLVVVGVHSPEFSFEKRAANVTKALHQLDVRHAVATDNDFAVWRTFGNTSWPALYVFDGSGRLRYHHPGEGRYDETESLIRGLLQEAGQRGVPEGTAVPAAQGVKAAAGSTLWGSPETYLGHARASGFAGGTLQRDRFMAYEMPPRLKANTWALAGSWTVRPEHAASDSAGTRIAYRFVARDVHFVLGPKHDGMPVRFRVLLDGQPPGENHGTDVDAQGYGLVDSQRLYQLIRLRGGARERLFEIEFLDPGVQAYAFTFG
jgi:cytochrome c biogenesis protein CcdA/thiol-disulfide isomerase/thioredoxin